MEDEEANYSEPVMILEMSSVETKEGCTECVTVPETEDDLLAAAFDSRCIIDSRDFVTCDKSNSRQPGDNCSDLLEISEGTEMLLPNASRVNTDISSPALLNPDLVNHYRPTDLFVSESENTPDAENDLSAAVTDGCSLDAESSNRSTSQQSSAIPPSASVDNIHGSGITHDTDTKSLVKISSAFIHLSASPATRRLHLGRDRARSESGKDSVAVDRIREDKAELPPKKASAKRVDSIRKSLIKLGSFGKDNGRGKSKKDKEREQNKTDNHEFPLRRTGSDKVSAGPFSLTLPSLQGQKLPENRLSGRFVTSPSPTLQTDISNPQAVADPKKLEQFSKQKMDTMQMMYDQARRECEELKQEYQKKPSEVIHATLEAKVKVVRRLESQLSVFAGDPDGPPGDKRFCQRGNSIDGSMMTVDGERDPTTRPPAPPPHYVQRHKGSDAGVTKPSCGKSDVSLSRSHSDSYKRIKNATGDRLRFTASTDEIQKLTAAGSGDFEMGSRHDSESRSRSKSQEAASDDSSDPALNHMALFSEHQTPTSVSSIHDSLDDSRQRQSNIIALDDYEFTSDEENPAQFEEFGSPFNDFSQLQTRHAHVAVFLHYLISNSDASPLLFYLMSGTQYSQGGLKELRKWAYEIFSTFLVDKAPLKVKVDDSYLEQIHDILLNKYDKEEPMRNIFAAVREKCVVPQINELLADFRSKRALGLGGIYGDHELREGLSQPAVLKIVESVLWKHFAIAYDDDSERSQVLASALATFFKQIGYTNMRNAHMQERCQTFNTKDKTKFSVFGKGAKREKSFSHRNHQFVPQHYNTVTNCHFCQSVLFGVGNQGYQCQKCDLNFHKSCLEKISEPCSGRRSGKPPNMFDKLIKKPSLINPAVGLEARMERTTSMPCVRDVSGRSTLSYKPSFVGLNFWDKSKGHKEMGVKGAEKVDLPKTIDEIKSNPPSELQSFTDNLPNDDHHHDMLESAKSPPSYTSSIVFSVPSYSSDGPPTYSSLNITAPDSDLEVEQDLPPLELVIPKEHLKRLEKKEKKRQEVINELFYTEKTHLRDIKVMQRLFYGPIYADPTFSDLAILVFPKIDEIVEFHVNLNNEFKQIRSTSKNGVVGDFAEILVTNFSGEKGSKFKSVCGLFCEKQSKAQEQLKARQRKDPRLAALLQEAASNPLCRRLTLKDFLPIPMQRLTKYPLLIENLIKYTSSDSKESVRLHSALDYSREILFFVNKAVNDYENRMKLLEIHKKLDKRPIENSIHPVVILYKNLDVRDYTLLFDGPLTWRISRDRMIALHVVLLDSILLLLQKQDDSRLVLRCFSTLITAGKEETKTTHSPIIRLSNLIIRSVATDQCAFFLVSVSEIGPQIYELVAGSKDEKNKWWKHIASAVEANRGAEPFQFKKAQKKSDSDSNFVTQDSERKHEGGLDAIDDEDEETSEVQKVDAAVSLALASHQMDSHQMDSHQMDNEHYFAPSSNSSAIDSSRLSTASLDPLDQLKQVDDLIHQMLCEKKKILSRICPMSSLNTDDKSEFCGEPCSQNDPRLKVVSALRDTDQLLCLVNSQCTWVGSENAVHSPGPPCAVESDTDKLTTPDCDGIASSFVPENLRSPLPTPINMSQIIELSSSIHRHLTDLQESVMRGKEEKQKLLMELQLLQEKLAMLELSHSEDQQTANEFSDQSVEPPADDEIIADRHEKEILPPDDILLPVYQSKDSESTATTNQAVSADADANTSLTMAEIIASENSDSQTAGSIQLAVDNVSDNNSTDA